MSDDDDKPTGWNQPGTVGYYEYQLQKANAENNRLRVAMERAAQIIDWNLYHQREKVQDASTILKQAMSAFQ